MSSNPLNPGPHTKLDNIHIFNGVPRKCSDIAQKLCVETGAIVRPLLCHR